MKKVYFYGTCLVDLFFPDAGMAGIQLLRQAGLEVVFPEGQTCCGQPAYNCGYWEEARAVARAQVGQAETTCFTSVASRALRLSRAFWPATS